MNYLTNFFLVCSGADLLLLAKCPTEKSKYAGLGATIFFTGLFAAAAAGYALFMVFDNVWIAIGCGVVWGLMIFNLDRYIVSSMRKEGKLKTELLTAAPRIVLAIIISIVIAKPLELKIFDKEISPELSIMERETYARQEKQVTTTFLRRQDSLKNELTSVKTEVAAMTQKRDELVLAAQQEADGTGGSRRRNLGPIYKAKKTDADKAEEELKNFLTVSNGRMLSLEEMILQNDNQMKREISAIPKNKIDGPAARMEALSRISNNSTAIWIANWFIILLFICLETAPVIVKLISPRGPYDNLLKIEEHSFFLMQVEALGKANSMAKERSSTLGVHEKEFISQRLDSALK
jgi:hypothetical protein